MAEQEQHGEKEHKKHGGGHGGHGGHEEAHEGAPEWLISFADNVTLLMGFFVICLAFNMGPKGSGSSSAATTASSPDFLDAVIGIRDAFHNPVSLTSTDPREQTLIRRILERRGQMPLEQDGPPGQKHKMQSIRPGKYFNLCGSVPFEDGSSMLTEAGVQAARDVLEHLRGLRLIVDIRGHTSVAEAFNTPDRGVRLSFERALAVAYLLHENGVDWRQMRVISCGDNDRVEPVTYHVKDQGPNQRVEVVLTEELMPDYTPTTDPQSSGPTDG
jgi:flagellar motor protein MotB